MYSVITPVYKNRELLPTLIQEFARVNQILNERHGASVEFVFVVDGCPQRCDELLKELLPKAPFHSQLVVHTRNFGSFAAIRTGLASGRGDCFSVIAADLQEPPELLSRFFEALKDADCDIVVGRRDKRDDGWLSMLLSRVFWRLCRAAVNNEIPSGGVDVFGCVKKVRDELLRLQEANSSLVGQLFWVGFRRKTVSYHRQARRHGRSAWTFSKKIAYFMNSILSFTDLPIRVLLSIGLVSLFAATLLGIFVTIARMIGGITVPGYAATIITISFFGALNVVAISIVGLYAWRAYENTKARPLAIVGESCSFGPQGENNGNCRVLE